MEQIVYSRNFNMNEILQYPLAVIILFCMKAEVEKSIFSLACMLSLHSLTNKRKYAIMRL